MFQSFKIGREIQYYIHVFNDELIDNKILR